MRSENRERREQQYPEEILWTDETSYSSTFGTKLQAVILSGM